MSEINHHKDHRKRLKNRFLSEGLDNFEVHNVLEFLLFFGIPQKDTNELAHELLDKFGSLSGVLEAPRSELLKFKDIGENTATLIQLIPPLSRIYLEDKIKERVAFDSTSAVGNYLLAKYRFRKDEMFSMLCLDQNCRLIKWVPISSGTINVTAVNTRKVVEAVMNTSANAVVLAHNHPAGLAVPSADDINSTIAIRKLIEPLGVTLLDHIIIANEDYVSLLESDQYKFVFK